MKPSQAAAYVEFYYMTGVPYHAALHYVLSCLSIDRRTPMVVNFPATPHRKVGHKENRRRGWTTARALAERNAKAKEKPRSNSKDRTMAKSAKGCGLKPRLRGPIYKPTGLYQRPARFGGNK